MKKRRRCAGPQGQAPEQRQAMGIVRLVQCRGRDLDRGRLPCAKFQNISLATRIEKNFIRLGLAGLIARLRCDP